MLDLKSTLCYEDCLEIVIFLEQFCSLVTALQALESGKLAQGGIITEGSAGSTAISLATVAPAYGCKCHVVIPDDVAIEKVCMSNSLTFHLFFLVYIFAHE